MDDYDPNGLILGSEPGTGLTILVVDGDRWSGSMMLHEFDLVTEQLGIPVAWPAAPVIVFSNDLETTATLSPDDDTSTVDAVATWDLTPEQAGTLKKFMSAKIRVDEVTWYLAEVVCLS